MAMPDSNEYTSAQTRPHYVVSCTSCFQNLRSSNWCGRVLFGQGAQLLSGCALACYPRHQGSKGVRQRQEQEDKRDEGIGDEVNGEVQEVTQRAHET